jgi:hypothetical protein
VNWASQRALGRLVRRRWAEGAGGGIGRPGEQLEPLVMFGESGTRSRVSHAVHHEVQQQQETPVSGILPNSARLPKFPSSNPREPLCRRGAAVCPVRCQKRRSQPGLGGSIKHQARSPSRAGESAGGGVELKMDVLGRRCTVSGSAPKCQEVIHDHPTSPPCGEQ